MILGQLIKAWRTERKLSLRKMARIIGIDHVVLLRLENNETQSITMDALAKVHQWMYSSI